MKTRTSDYHKSTRRLLVILAILLTVPTGMTSIFNGSALALASPIERASLDSSSTEGNNYSYDSSISADGRYIAFISAASNLVASDTNGKQDIFVKDTKNATITRVSTDSSGTQSNGDCYSPRISADGRYVSFDSYGSNLVASDTNVDQDVFLKDTQTGTTTRISTDSSGTQSNGYNEYSAISADGRYVSFQSTATNMVAGDTNGLTDVFLKDTQTGTTTRVSTDSSGTQSNGGNSGNSAISPDGRYVAFESVATNLVAGDTNGYRDIFLKDTQTGTVSWISTDSSGAQATGGDSFYPSIASNGRYMAFQSSATNLVAGDTNGLRDVFVKDLQTGTTTRASTDSTGTQSNLNSYSYSSSISADGRYVAFESYATNLVAGDTNGNGDIFIKDTQSSTTVRVSTDASGAQSSASGDSYTPNISSDGHYVSFSSNATNLVASDTNASEDVFVKTLSDPNQVGPQPIGRSLRVTTSVKSATSVNWIFSFQMPSSASPLQSVRLLFCTTAIGTCTQPTGLDVSSYSIASQTFTQATSFTAQSSDLAQCTAGTNSQYEVCVKRTDTNNEAAAPDQKVLTLSGITNPSVTGAVFVRITLYGNSGFTAAGRIGDGAVATAIVNQLTVNARVQEKLIFCVGAVSSSVISNATTPANCADSAFTGSNQTVDLGVVDSTTASISPVTAAAGGNDKNGAALISTNAVNGATIAYFAEQDTGSNHLGALRVPGASCSAGVSSTDQCFNSAGTSQIDFSTTGEKFGMTVSAVYRPTGSTTTNLSRTTDYDGDGSAGIATGGFAWDDSGTNNPATTIASSSTVMDYEMLLLRFAARAASTTPTGAYTVTSTYVAVATY